MNVTTESRENEAKFRLLFENSPDAMLLLDGDAFVDCNQAAVEMMRCAGKEQLLALRPYDISPKKQPDGRLSNEKARDLIATAFREGSLRFEWVHRAVDGTDFPVEVLLTAIPLRGRKVLHVAWRDITERQRADEVAGAVPVIALAPDPALGRRLNLLELLFDRMPMGVAVFDREYCVQRYNSTWEDFAERYAPPGS
jgi:PAS domain S-box-containing protein